MLNRDTTFARLRASVLRHRYLGNTMVGSQVSSNVRRHTPFRSPGHHRRTLSRALRMKTISNLIAATALLFQWPRRASRKLQARSVARTINRQAVCVITLVSRTDGSERRHYAGSGAPPGAIEHFRGPRQRSRPASGRGSCGRHQPIRSLTATP
jgi:hypothetical protein